MQVFIRRLIVLFSLGLTALSYAGTHADPSRVWPEGHADRRAASARTLYQGSGFQPFTDRAAWESRAKFLREQVLVASGLWPLPERCPLNPVIHSPIDRGDYTVEKVFFQSYPGFYVTGSLYRPKGKTGPFPVVLSPHGHWKDGRFYDAGEKEAQKQIAGGWEKDMDAARYPLQARCANLARLGCIVFHYDMVGYADADPERFIHRQTYRDVDSDQRLISVFGLQTWNSIRALDFVLSLPDVDPTRTACTGASGGATQTFILMTIDDRLKFAAPVCMISAGDHQGGCVCENNSLLRVDTDNVELAATFAPKPFIHPTATGDWTKAFMEHGYPEIKATYKLFDAEANMQAVRYEANHNYNLKNREAVYQFFNKHMKLGAAEPVIEHKFTPILPGDLSVFDAAHPRPANAVDPVTLKKYLIESTEKQLDALMPIDAKSLATAQQTFRAALRHMLATDLPASESVVVQQIDRKQHVWGYVEKLVLSRGDRGDSIPVLRLTPAYPIGPVTVVICEKGKAELLNADELPTATAAAILARGETILAPDVYLTGELASAKPVTKVDGKPIEFRAGYNRTILGNRVHDILTTIAFARSMPSVKVVNLLGDSQAGTWCLLARALAGNAVTRLIADESGANFAEVTSVDDELYLPGSLRYRDLPFWATMVAAPGDTFLFNHLGEKRGERLSNLYKAIGADTHLQLESKVPDAKTVAGWLVR